MSVLCNNSSYNLYLQKRFSGNQLAMGSNQPFLEFTHVTPYDYHFMSNSMSGRNSTEAWACTTMYSCGQMFKQVA